MFLLTINLQEFSIRINRTKIHSLIKTGFKATKKLTANSANGSSVRQKNFGNKKLTINEGKK
jgi:hypothetical protein